ncbi:MAG: pilus assembly protein TadG-related protein [Methyloligellaceae bacterium]
MFRGLVRLIRGFGSDRRGNVIIIFGFSVIPIALTIGLAIDYSRALNVKQRLGSALDAAALAVAASTGLTDDQLQEKAQAYFDANYPESELGTAGEISVSSNEHKVTMSVTGQVETTFMQIAGHHLMDVGASVEVTKKQRKIELVMALDNTGSMRHNGKIGALKDASELLIDILFGEETVSTDIKVGLVPFAAAVNIGSENLNSGWIDINAQSSLAAEDFTPGTNVLALYDQITNRTWNGCVRARPEPFDTQDTLPTVAAPDTLWVPYFVPDEPDFSGYANRYVSDEGYEGGHFDYDARQRYSGKYAGLTIPGWEDDGPDDNCRTPTVTAMTNVKADLITAIDAMVSTGYTVIPAGLAWGWRLISPSEPFIEGAEYDDEDTVKAIILLTDGRNDVNGGTGNHNRSRYSAYGYAQSGHLGSTNGSQAESTLNTKTSTLCTNIKEQNIRLYTITFQLSDGPIKDLMRDCASKTSMYYDSPSNSELQTVFEDIAKGLSELRISK